MRRDLARPIAPAPLPKDVTLVPFGAAVAAACRALMNDVYADGFGDRIAFEDWWPALVADAEYDPALCLVGTSEGKVVGFCHAWSSAFIKDLVVAPACRGRGIAGALVTLQLEAFAHRSAPFLDLKTDKDNAVAQSLYRRLGFAIVREDGD